jgi:hypothetical protein
MTHDASRRQFLRMGTRMSALAAVPSTGLLDGLRARLRAWFDVEGREPFRLAARDDEDSMWPYVLEFDGSEVVLYQPQPERMDGTRLFGRAAISVKSPEAKAAAFGTAWFNCRIDVDQEERIYAVKDIDVSEVKIPQVDQPTLDLAKAMLTEGFSDFDGVFELDPLLESLEAANIQATALKDLANDPPKIVTTSTEAMLVTIDGEPIMAPVEKGKGVRKVDNTPFTILEDTIEGKFYLLGEEWWYIADSAKGPWTETEGVPKHIRDAVPDLPDPYKEEEEEALAMAKEAPKEGEPRAPAIVVATEPTELLWSDGQIQWKPVPNTSLKYASNSSGNVIRTSDGRIYTPLSGRWYTGPSIEGPWTYVPPDEVPAGFAKIPKDADIAGVLPFVPGTDEAKAALQEQQVPTTAEVKKGATTQVTWAGDPIMEKVPGLDLEWSKNASAPVLRTSNAYYACVSGVWYQGPSTNGPFRVATSVPAEIYKLPASHPFHFVTYVRVFGEGDDVVYTGYYPGYKGSYSNGQTVVHGTGYTPQPVVVNNVYVRQPMPPMWGFSVHYNPWFGWSMGLSFGFGAGAGWFRFVIPIGGGARWFGPVGFNPWWRPPFFVGMRPPVWGRPVFRPPYFPAYRPGGNVNRPGGGGSYRPAGGWQQSNRPRPQPRPGVGGGNIYNRPGNAGITRPVSRPQSRPATTLPNVGGKPSRPATPPGGRPTTQPGGRPTTMPSKDNRPTSRPADRPNNVYSDKSGNVWRDTPKGWQENKGGGQWQSNTGGTKPAPGASTRPAPGDVGGYQQARDRAQARPSNPGYYGGAQTRPGNTGGQSRPSYPSGYGGSQGRPAPQQRPQSRPQQAPAPRPQSRPAPAPRGRSR